MGWWVAGRNQHGWNWRAHGVGNCQVSLRRDSQTGAITKPNSPIPDMQNTISLDRVILELAYSVDYR